MRRLIIIGTALAVLGGATAAYAAFFNNYSGSKNLFAPKVAGSKAKPAAIGRTEILKAGTAAPNRAAPLIDIKTTVYGVITKGGSLPKCTSSMISNAGATHGYDKVCPKGSLIGIGPLHSLLGPSSDPSASSGSNCDALLHVYNSGPKTITYFFTNDAQHKCGVLTTGSTAPYEGHISRSGNNWIIDVPLPPDISNKVANQAGLYGSLVSQTIVYSKTSGWMKSVACKQGKRPWSIRFTDQDYNGGKVTQTLKGNDHC